MAISSDTTTRQTVVTVRVPHGTDGDLTTETQRRLRRADGVLAVTVESLRDLQPGLSATEVTVAVTVETDRRDTAVAAALGDLTGVAVEPPGRE